MKKEKHIVNKIYGNHQLARYIDVYEVSANRCHSVPESGYKGTEATLVDEPAWNEKFSSYSITGATLTGNNFILNNDVTAQANYETAKNLTLQTDGHGTIAANRNSGFIGDQVTLSNTPATNYSFSGYTITGATLTGNKFNFIGNDVTAKAWFSAEPSYTSRAITNAMMGVDQTVGAREYLPDHTYQVFNYSYDSTNFYREVPSVTSNIINLNVFANGLSVNSVRNMSAYSTDFTTGKDILFTTYSNKYIKLTGSQSAVITSISFDFSGTWTGRAGTQYESYEPFLRKMYFSAGNTSATANYITANGVIEYHKNNLVLNTPVILTAGQHNFTLSVNNFAGAYPYNYGVNQTAQEITWNGYISGQV